jgi:hypothetical protein
MLTDTQLEVLCRKMSIPLAGIFFKNELPRKIETNKGYIINIEDSHDDEGNENSGTHWTCLFVRKYENGVVEPIYFDSYGAPPPEYVKQVVKQSFNKYLPYTTKDIQSLMSQICGWFVCSFLYGITSKQMACGDLYRDVEQYIEMFDDLNNSHEWKKNEYILKCFFRSEDASRRTPIDLDIEEQEDSGCNKVPICINMMH